MRLESELSPTDPHWVERPESLGPPNCPRKTPEGDGVRTFLRILEFRFLLKNAETILRVCFCFEPQVRDAGLLWTVPSS